MSKPATFKPWRNALIRIARPEGRAARAFVSCLSIAVAALVGLAVVVMGQETEQTLSVGLSIEGVVIVKPPSSEFPLFPDPEGGTDGFRTGLIPVTVETNCPTWAIELDVTSEVGRQILPDGTAARLVDPMGFVLNEGAVVKGRAVLSGSGPCGSLEFYIELSGEWERGSTRVEAVTITAVGREVAMEGGARDP
jgi:hypothetical protein